jgi:hypothetical protein
MLVEQRPITSIRPYDNNPRVNDPAVDAVAASIREFGFRQPIVVDEQDVIIVGHTRFKAALKLGLEMVPVHVAVGLSPPKPRLTASPTTKRRRCPIGTTTACPWNWPNAGHGI